MIILDQSPGPTVRSPLLTTSASRPGRDASPASSRDVWEPIISEDERQALITILSDPSRKTSPGNQPKWLGSLIYRCGVCDDDTTMSVRKQTGGLAVYRCRSKGHNSRDAVALDGYVAEVLLNVLSRDAGELLSAPQTVDVESLTTERQTLQAKLQTLTDLFVADALTREQLEYQTAKIKGRLDSISAELSAAASSSPFADFVGVDDVRAQWDRCSIGEQREILRTALLVSVLPGSVRDVDHEHVQIRCA